MIPARIDLPTAPEHKIVHSVDLLRRRLALCPRPWVFTNGVFDLLHRGHAAYLHQARALGGCLIVALNTDHSARQLGKGPGRPLNPQQDRAFLVAALASSSFVTWFDEPTPVALIEQLKPDIYVKGGDYDMPSLAETALVRRWGGRAVAIPFLPGHSSTRLIQAMQTLPSPPATSSHRGQG